MERSRYFTLTHHQPEIKTVGDFLFQEGLNVLKGQKGGSSAKLITDVSAEEFLKFKDSEGVSNQQRIVARYTPEQRAQKHDGAAMPLVYGTDLVVPYSKVTREFLLTSGNIVADNKDVNYFLASQQEALLRDHGYTRSFDTKQLTSIGSVKELYPLLSVWCWCRSLSEDDTGNGRLVNLTPFVKSLTTNVTATGGNFTMELTPVQGTFGPDGKGGVFVNFANRQLNSSSNISGYYTQSVVGGEERPKTFLHNLLGQNDVIFIRFEQTQGEQRREEVCNKFVIPTAELPGQLYDMIGLVDTNTLNTTSEGAQTLQIKGRDLMKLLIEDGSYFYPLEFAQGMFYHTGNRDNGADSLTLRSLASGKLMTAALMQQRSIDFSLRFILQHLSNVSVAPDKLFESWGTRRTTKFAAEQDENYNQQRREWAAEMDLFRTEGVQAVQDSRRIYNLQRAEPKAEGIATRDLFGKIIGFVQALEKEGKLNNSGDKLEGWEATTYNGEKVAGNHYPKSFFNTLFVPSKTGDASFAGVNADLAIASAFRYLDRKAKLENFVGAPFKERPAKGIWSIIKLEIDENVTNRRLVDTSIASEQGSIFNSIKKMCHDPFVQFSGDTFGDQYYFTVRQAPFTKEAMRKCIEGGVHLQVHSAEVLNDSLQFCNQVYSWYRLTPKASLMGNGEEMALAFLPAVYFPEFANVYGSKPLDVTTNYVPYSGLQDSGSKTNQNYVEKQAFYDLKYLIDCHSYLPFTRQGTITILPNRAIKRGTFIYYALTNEYFYVDDVTQNYALNEGSIQRTTTLNVSRGMVATYIDPNAGPSYFNVVETPLNDQQFDGEKGRAGVFDNWRVNPDSFDFFQRRGQFNNLNEVAPLVVAAAPVTPSVPAKPKALPKHKPKPAPKGHTVGPPRYRG
jgi:hypothetical protein